MVSEMDSGSVSVRFERWLESLCFVLGQDSHIALGQDTSLTHCLVFIEAPLIF